MPLSLKFDMNVSVSALGISRRAMANKEVSSHYYSCNGLFLCVLKSASTKYLLRRYKVYLGSKNSSE